MMTIEEETDHIENFLLHPAGFDVSYTLDSFGKLVSLYPKFMDNRIRWITSWTEKLDDSLCEFSKCFDHLHDAVVCFVEKRRYLCLGLDFDNLLNQEENNEQETE